MRVLYWGMSSNIGGIESFIMNVYRNIDREKIQIDFLVAHDKEKIAFEDEITQLGGKIYRVMYSERESFIKARTSLKKFFNEHNDFSAIHIHANFPYAFPLKYAKKAGIPIRIIHSHNSNGNSSNAMGIRRMVNKVRDFQIKRQIDKYANYYFACSDLAANYMFPNKEYIWIKNGVNLKKYDFNPKVRGEVRKELKIGYDEQVLGFVGRLREQKNPYFIIDIFREYLKINSRTKLVIVGIGEWEDEIKKYSSDLIDNNQALFLGKRTDVERIYQAFDAFLLPSLYEGLPVVLVESQAAGLPSFTSDVVTQQVNVTKLMHYYPLDIGANMWAKNIAEVLSNNMRKSYMREMEYNNFDEVSVAKELETFYLSSRE